MPPAYIVFIVTALGLFELYWPSFCMQMGWADPGSPECEADKLRALQKATHESFLLASVVVLVGSLAVSAFTNHGFLTEWGILSVIQVLLWQILWSNSAGITYADI